MVSAALGKGAADGSMLAVPLPWIARCYDCSLAGSAEIEFLSQLHAELNISLSQQLAHASCVCMCAHINIPDHTNVRNASLSLSLSLQSATIKHAARLQNRNTETGANSTATRNLQTQSKILELCHRQIIPKVTAV